MRLAYAWEDGKLVGAFSEEGGRVGFRYLPAATHPISLSLPLCGGWADSAPMRFLEGLLPDNESERSAMMRTFGARSLHPMDLLISADATGGLCFTEDDSAPVDRRLRKQVATPREVALKISRLALDRGSWQSDDQRSRFSLAGSQNKFSLGRYGSRWVWPNAKYPSTHIIKPDNARFPDAPFVEFATMELAARCGIPTARPAIVDFDGEKAYAVERFDRTIAADGSVKRLHIEDLSQSLGISRDEKYSVSVADVASLLGRQRDGERLVDDWLRQLAFNTLVGNRDAHAKNYSVMIADGGARLCPLYDSLCTAYWPQVSDVLAMPVNGKSKSGDIGLSDWAAEAALDGLYQTRMVEIVAQTAVDIAYQLDSVSDLVPDEVAQRLADAVYRSSETTFRDLGLIDAGGRRCAGPSFAKVPFSMLPRRIERDLAPVEAFSRIEDAGEGEVAAFMVEGLEVATGQNLDSRYIKAPAGSYDPHRGIAMDGASRLDVYDARMDIVVDQIVWNDLCAASRAASAKTGYLTIDRMGGKAATVRITRETLALEASDGDPGAMADAALGGYEALKHIREIASLRESERPSAPRAAARTAEPGAIIPGEADDQSQGGRR